MDESQNETKGTTETHTRNYLRFTFFPPFCDFGVDLVP